MMFMKLILYVRKNSIDVTKDSLDDMVKYVKENNLLDYVSSEQTIE